MDIKGGKNLGVVVRDVEEGEGGLDRWSRSEHVED
jgi:hypothetical protein